MKPSRPKPDSVFEYTKAERAYYKRLWLFDEQDGKCYYCQSDLSLDEDDEMYATMEHLKQKQHGGTLKKGNMVVACGRCNGWRKDEHPELWKVIHDDSIKLWEARQKTTKKFRKVCSRKIQEFRQDRRKVANLLGVFYKYTLRFMYKYYTARKLLLHLKGWSIWILRKGLA